MYQRNLGLDILRSAAIVGVIIYHLFWYLPGGDLGSMVPVELFFSLSGFLIAQMIVERFDRISTWAAVQAFVINRWMRTLPLYWIALIGHAAIQMAVDPGHPGQLASLVTANAFFVQNLSNDAIHYGSNFFAASWSLCIEEWFYLLCPLVLLALGCRSARFWSIVGSALVLVAIGARLNRYLVTDSGLSTMYSYRMATLFRPDVFVYGMAVYFCMNRIFARRWMRLVAFACGLLMTATNFWLDHGDHEGMFGKIFLPSTAPLAMALLIPAMTRFQIVESRWLQIGTKWLSTRTYAVYLFHGPIFALYIIPEHSGPARILMTLIVTLLAANFMHVYVERPIMNRRPMRALSSTDIPVEASSVTPSA